MGAGRSTAPSKLVLTRNSTSPTLITQLGSFGSPALSSNKEIYLSTFGVRPLYCRGRLHTRELKALARVIRKVDNAIHRINQYPVDSVVCFVNTYPLDSDLSDGEHYPSFLKLINYSSS